MTATSRPINPRIRALVACLLALLVTWVFFHQQINQTLAVNLLLRSENPSEELFEDLANKHPDPGSFLRRCWATGKIAHRQLVAAYLKQKSSASPPWLEPLAPLLAAGTTDADMSVRELSLGTLSLIKSPRLFDCSVAQLTDLDPLVRLLGLDYLGKADPAKALPLIIPLLDDPDPRVVARADHALTRWTGQDFGVRTSLAIPSKDEGRADAIDAANTNKIRQGVARWKEWWSAHKNEFTAAQTLKPNSGTRELSRLPVSDFKLYDLENNPVRLADFRGKVVLLNFWATWCTACLAEIPDLIALEKRLGDKVAVLGVSLDGVLDEHGHEPGEETENEHHSKAPSIDKIREKVHRAVQTRGINYVVLLDPENAVGGRFNGGELPTTVIIDADGRVTRRFIGERNLQVFEAMIAEATALPSQPKPSRD